VRLRSIALTSVFVAAAVVLPGSTAMAASDCSLVLPEKVVVDQASESIPVRLSSNCLSSAADHADWRVLDARYGGWNIYWREIDSTDTTTGARLGFSGTDPVGAYTGYPKGAGTVADEPLTQNRPFMTIKYAARLGLSGTNKHGNVTLTAYASSWSGKLGRFYPRAGVKVQVLRHKSADWWVYDRTVTTNGEGRVTIPIGYSHPGDAYKVRIVETATVWASGSPPYRVG
jgi:hypothetical protein